MNTHGFRALVRQAQAGDQAAIDALFGRLLPYVERVVRSTTLHLGPEESARDLAQTACLRVLVKLHQLKARRPFTVTPGHAGAAPGRKAGHRPRHLHRLSHTNYGHTSKAA
jgi:hypothetical protein